MERRQLLKLGFAGAGLIALSSILKMQTARARTTAPEVADPETKIIGVAKEKIVPIEKTNAQWKKILTADQYYILREEGTERPYTSALLHEKREGIFACVACDLPLFDAKTKFDSGTGWPSFYESIAGHLGSTTDYKLNYPRTEYHCVRCGGHHGHVFDDGPKPTGLRYCNNGVALKFIPKTA